MTAEYSASDGGELARQFEQDKQRMMLLKTVGDPMVVMLGEEIVSIGISHGVRDDEVWIRNNLNELNTYNLDKFTFAAADESDVAKYLGDILLDTTSRGDI